MTIRQHCVNLKLPTFVPLALVEYKECTFRNTYRVSLYKGLVCGLMETWIYGKIDGQLSISTIVKRNRSLINVRYVRCWRFVEVCA